MQKSNYLIRLFLSRFTFSLFCAALISFISNCGLSQQAWAADTDDFSSNSTYEDGGETTGANRTLGNQDNFDLDIITNDTSRITVENTGNVGIGTSTPNQPLEVNGTIKSVETQIASGATLNINWSQGNQQTVLSNQNVSSVTFTNVFPGQIFRMVACQDGSGNRTISGWPANVDFPNGATTVTLSTGANECDVISFIATDAAGVPGGTVILGTIVRGFQVL